jgi:hypothetical protein
MSCINVPACAPFGKEKIPAGVSPESHSSMSSVSRTSEEPVASRSGISSPCGMPDMRDEKLEMAGTKHVLLPPARAFQKD